MQQIWLHVCCRSVLCFTVKDMWGQTANCWLVAASETLHSQRAQVAGSLGLRSSVSHSQCVEMWRWRWRQAARHHAEEQAAARANDWSQQIKEVYPDNVSGYSQHSVFSLKKAPSFFFFLNKYTATCVCEMETFWHYWILNIEASLQDILLQAKGRMKNVIRIRAKLKWVEKQNNSFLKENWRINEYRAIRIWKDVASITDQ